MLWTASCSGRLGLPQFDLIVKAHDFLHAASMHHHVTMLEGGEDSSGGSAEKTEDPAGKLSMTNPTFCKFAAMGPMPCSDDGDDRNDAMFLNEKTEAKMSDFTPDMSACVDEAWRASAPNGLPTESTPITLETYKIFCVKTGYADAYNSAHGFGKYAEKKKKK